jgi:cytochrome b6-f complex iron-sulfur subunit
MSAGGSLARPEDREPITSRAIAAQRHRPTTGLSRRTLLRRSIGAGAAVWIVEVLGGVIGSLWPASARSTPRVRVGTMSDLIAMNGGLPIADGFPAYVPDARAFVMTIDPTRPWQAGSDLTGDGVALNVRAVSQRCPHLGCRPNPCIEDFWFRCPCHQSRYDRLGIKAAGVTYGPAARSMDRYAVEVDGEGVLTIDTSHVALGPLPVALGQPGLIPPRVPNGCS